MDNWSIVVVIIALVGLVTAIVTPIIKLNTTVTKLIALVDVCARDLGSIDRRNSESHERIYRRLDACEDVDNDHEQRIGILEHDFERSK